jgi:hypothetical protein
LLRFEGTMASDPQKRMPSAALVDLDDPTFDLVEEEERSPDTARPDYDTDKFALDLESAKSRMTAPPAATYEMLRDSCKSEIAEEAALDEEEILRPSSRKHRISPPR